MEKQSLRVQSQAGGRPKQGVHQHLFTIQHLKDLYKAPIRKGGRAAPLFMCCIDFEKAFDKVDRNLIWIRLEERGIHGKFLNAIKAVDPCISCPMDRTVSDHCPIKAVTIN